MLCAAHLPVEILNHILSFLDVGDIVVCSSVANRLRKVIAESSRLQYVIELEKHRMVSISSPTERMSYSSRLKLLQTREQAWSRLAWSGRYRLKVPPAGSVYEFVGGLYGNGKEDDHKITASISFLELPSSNTASTTSVDFVDLRTWTHTMLDMTIIDFTMDPSQDLLVLITMATTVVSGYAYELHLRSLSTNEPHPRAPLPILPCLLKPSHTPQNPDLIASIRVQVSGPLVALLIKEVHESTGAYLEIWDWLNNPHHSCKFPRAGVDDSAHFSEETSGIDDFTFLSQDAFLLARPTGRLEVYAFENPITPSTVPICQASYSLPPLANGYRYWYITMSNSPSPGSIPRPQSVDAFGRRELYHPKPDERIHACCLYIYNPSPDEHRVHCFVFFVNLRTLLHPPPEWLKGKSLLTGQHKTSRQQRGLIGVALPEAGGSLLTQSFRPTNSLASLPVGLPPLPTSPAPPLLRFSLTIPGFTAHTPIPIQKPKHIPWEVWGPPSTRWFRGSLTADWQHSIYGLKTIETVAPDMISYATLQFPVVPTRQNSPNTTEKDSGSTASDELGSATSMANGMASTTSSPTGNASFDAQTSHTDVNHTVNADGERREPSPPMRFLRLRDFNPYRVKQCLEEQNNNKDKGKRKVNWNEPRVVSGPSMTQVQGIFAHDIVSCLPYVEVVSEEMFQVTDVMMDDCRLLLLKRGDNGRLDQVEVLTL